MIRPAAADRKSGVVDWQKKESLFYGKKSKVWPVVKLWGCGTCEQGIISDWLGIGIFSVGILGVCVGKISSFMVSLSKNI